MPHVPGAKVPYERSLPEGFEPGTFGCHEALHLASTFMSKRRLGCTFQHRA